MNVPMHQMGYVEAKGVYARRCMYSVRLAHGPRAKAESELQGPSIFSFINCSHYHQHVSLHDSALNAPSPVHRPLFRYPPLPLPTTTISATARVPSSRIESTIKLTPSARPKPSSRSLQKRRRRTRCGLQFLDRDAHVSGFVLGLDEVGEPGGRKGERGGAEEFGGRVEGIDWKGKVRRAIWTVEENVKRI